MVIYVWSTPIQHKYSRADKCFASLVSAAACTKHYYIHIISLHLHDYLILALYTSQSLYCQYSPMSGRGKSGILFFQRGPGPEFKFGKMKRVELQNHRRSSGTYRNLVGWGGGGASGSWRPIPPKLLFANWFVLC